MKNMGIEVRAVKQTIDGQQDPGRGGGVNSEKLEHAADQERIKWRLPCARSGRITVGIAEALAQGDRIGPRAPSPSRKRNDLPRHGSDIDERCRSPLPAIPERSPPSRAESVRIFSGDEEAIGSGVEVDGGASGWIRVQRGGKRENATGKGGVSTCRSRERKQSAAPGEAEIE